MREKSLRDLLAAFEGKRILVVGDVMLDEYIWGEVRRISPEAPVPVVEMQRRTYVPGGAANAAANVVSLGGVALLGGVVGKDREAGILGEALRQVGVDAQGLVVDQQRITTTKTRILAHNQQIVRVDCEQRAALSPQAENTLYEWVESNLDRIDACILSDYAKGLVSRHSAGLFIRAARQAGKPVIVDPKGADYAKYHGATVVKPNLQEAERFLKHEIHGEDGLLTAGQELLAALEDSAVLLTRGPHGMSLFRDGQRPLHIPSVARDIFDVTGAGDTVLGTLALALSAGGTLEQAAFLANRAAGVVVSKVGTATVTLDELRSITLRPERRPRKPPAAPGRLIPDLRRPVATSAARTR